MPNKIYYITRSWSINGNNCANLRAVYARFLEAYATVIIVTPNYDSRDIFIDDRYVRFPIDRYQIKLYRQLSKLNIKDDYLDSWVNDTYKYLKNIVREDDWVFATTGGEVASIKLAAKLKIHTNCKMIVNFRDPINGTHIFGEIIKSYKGLPKDKIAKKYCDFADSFIAFSDTYCNILKSQYKTKADRIYSHYIGYIEQADLSIQKKNNNIINIVYSGTNTPIQNARILYEAFGGKEGVKVTYICENPEALKKTMPEENVDCIGLMPHDRYMKYMRENADIGFVSLTTSYSKVAFPSKTAEYINLSIPILGSLPDGEASNIINSNGYGIACDDGNIIQLQEALNIMKNPPKYQYYVENIMRDRDLWYSENRKQSFFNIIDDLNRAL